MKKSLVALMACAIMGAASASIVTSTSSQAPPGMYAATSNKVEGVKEVNNQQPVASANFVAEGKAFVLTPMVWRPAATKGQAPPLIAVGFDKNYIGRAHPSKTLLGEPPGAAVLI